VPPNGRHGLPSLKIGRIRAGLSYRQTSVRDIRNIHLMRPLHPHALRSILRGSHRQRTQKKTSISSRHLATRTRMGPQKYLVRHRRSHNHGRVYYAHTLSFHSKSCLSHFLSTLSTWPRHPQVLLRHLLHRALQTLQYHTIPPWPWPHRQTTPWLHYYLIQQMGIHNQIPPL